MRERKREIEGKRNGEEEININDVYKFLFTIGENSVLYKTRYGPPKPSHSIKILLSIDKFTRIRSRIFWLVTLPVLGQIRTHSRALSQCRGNILRQMTRVRMN